MKTTATAPGAAPTLSRDSVVAALVADLTALEGADWPLPRVAAHVGIVNLRTVRQGRDCVGLAAGLSIAALALRHAGASALLSLVEDGEEDDALDGCTKNEAVAILAGAGQGVAADEAGHLSALVSAQIHFGSAERAARKAGREVAHKIKALAADRIARSLGGKPRRPAMRRAHLST